MPDVRKWYTFSIREIFFLTTIAALVICWSLDNLKKREIMNGIVQSFEENETMLRGEVRRVKDELRRERDVCIFELETRAQRESTLREDVKALIQQNDLLKKLNRELETHK